MSRLKKIFQSLFNKRERGNQLECKNIEEIFKEIDEVNIKRKRMTAYLEEVHLKEQAYQCYKNLEEEDIEKISYLAQQAKAIEEKKGNLKGRLIRNNAALSRLAEYEEVLPQTLQEMQSMQKRRQETESHLLYLQEEKMFLIEERESLLAGYRFLKGFSLMLILVMSVSLMITFLMLQILRAKIWFMLTFVAAIVGFSIVIIVLIKEKLEKEIKNNSVLQQKAVRYINKAKIRLFNQVQYLEAQYQKFGVDSVAKLEMHYNRYLKNKDNEMIYLKMNQNLMEIEDKILEILHMKGILLQEVGQISDWLLKPRGLKEIEQLEKNRIQTEEQLKALEAYETEMWKELSVLGEDAQMRESIEALCLEYGSENRLDKICVSAYNEK